MKKKIYLSLTGGLGNQLFQIAAALSIANGHEIVIEWVNSRPRLNSNLRPELEDYSLPSNIKFQERHKYYSLPSKSVGYLLRSGIKPKKFERFRIVKFILKFLAALLHSRTLKAFAWIRVNEGVGYDPNVRKNFFYRVHLVGYFQTYLYVDSLPKTSASSQFEIKERSGELENLMILSKQEDPLIVHMRFGDYRNESSFGLLHAKYYIENITESWNSGLYKSVWVFSDEISEAKRYLQTLDACNIRYISDVANSSSQTLEAMRLGKGFIIGNSSFSWWAAKLARRPDVKVIAPMPWFVGQEDPIDLIPPYWTRRIGH